VTQPASGRAACDTDRVRRADQRTCAATSGYRPFEPASGPRRFPSEAPAGTAAASIRRLRHSPYRPRPPLFIAPAICPPGPPFPGTAGRATRTPSRVTQSRQNSVPSMSCITMHDSMSSSAGSRRTRTVPSATSRAHSASSAAGTASPMADEEQPGNMQLASPVASLLARRDPTARQSMIEMPSDLRKRWRS